MGCSSSIVFDFDKFNPFNLFKDEETNTSKETFEIRKEKFQKIQTISDLIASDELIQIADKLLDKKADAIKNGMDKIWEKNKEKFEENSITRITFEKGFYNILADRLIKKDFLKSDQNLIKNFENFISGKNLLTKFEHEKVFEILYDPVMDLANHEKVITLFSPEEEGEEKEKIAEKNIFLNLIDKLKYDESSYPSAIYLHLNNENLKSTIISEFCEGIAHNEKLSFIAVVLNPISIDPKTHKKYLYNLNPLMYRNLYKIIDSIGKNENIKHFILTSTFESQIILAPEISNLLINKLNSDTLLGFHIGKFLLTENALKEMFNALSNLNKLKYFSFDIRVFNNRMINYFRENITRNKSIEILGIFGFIYPEKEYENLKRDLQRNYSLKMLLNKELIEF